MLYNNSYYPQPQPYKQQPMFVGLKGRPVSSLEEARASSIDFDGSVFFFPDFANKKIYTKQINLDGTASLIMYEQVPIPEETKPAATAQFVTKEEFEQTVKDLRNAVSSLGNAPQEKNSQPPQPRVSITPNAF